MSVGIWDSDGPTQDDHAHISPTFGHFDLTLTYFMDGLLDGEVQVLKPGQMVDGSAKGVNEKRVEVEFTIMRAPVPPLPTHSNSPAGPHVGHS